MAGQALGALNGVYLGIRYVNGVPQGSAPAGAATSYGLSSPAPKITNAETVIPAPKPAVTQPQQSQVVQSTYGYSPDTAAIASMSQPRTMQPAPAPAPIDTAAERQANISDLTQQLGILSSQPTPAHVATGGTPTGDTPLTAAARSAAFARAKDTAAQTSRASLDALNNILSERGLLGGGYESAGAGNVIAANAGALGDITREQAVQDAARASQVADQTYQGDIAQRGQDLGYRQSLLGLIRATGA